ncbi:Gfo/Idh/MocA family oxidoreductase [Salinibacterium sp. TMP30]|uniref:Gfo/Idh/MocA family protein n=1 Tax=Salinibacterium sp. TMP30 TaxID=3138237 RepID=UPI0031390641
MVKVALIGAGAVADLHAKSIVEVNGIEMVGVCDTDVELAANKAEKWGTRHYSNSVAVFNDDSVDAVLVLTHMDSHLELASNAISAGKHVFLEKPVSKSAEGIEALSAQAKAANLVCMPDHNYAYIPEFRRLKRIADRGDLGTIRSFHMNYVIPHDEELASRYTGILEEVMIHHSYLTLSILGKPDWVVAGVAKPGWKLHKAEDQAWMAWDYDSGASAHHFASFATDDLSNDPWTCIVKVLGTNGSAEVNWRTSMFNRKFGTHSFAWVAYEESFSEALSAFRDAVQEEVPFVSTLDDAATSARIIEKAYLAAKEHRSIPRIDPQGKAAW